MTYTIDKGIPLPPQRQKYPFVDMEVGDSIELEVTRSSVGTSIANCQRATGRKFTVRKTEKGIRVWRVA